MGDYSNPIESTVRDAKRAVHQVQNQISMSGTEQNIRLAIGSAAAAAAIFAPLSYTWKGVLTGVAAASILTGIYGVSPVRKLINA